MGETLADRVKKAAKKVLAGTIIGAAMLYLPATAKAQEEQINLLPCFTVKQVVSIETFVETQSDTPFSNIFKVGLDLNGDKTADTAYFLKFDYARKEKNDRYVGLNPWEVLLDLNNNGSFEDTYMHHLAGTSERFRIPVYKPKLAEGCQSPTAKGQEPNLFPYFTAEQIVSIEFDDKDAHFPTISVGIHLDKDEWEDMVYFVRFKKRENTYQAAEILSVHIIDVYSNFRHTEYGMDHISKFMRDFQYPRIGEKAGIPAHTPF